MSQSLDKVFGKNGQTKPEGKYGAGTFAQIRGQLDPKQIPDCSIDLFKLHLDTSTRLVAQGGTEGQVLSRTKTIGQVWVDAPQVPKDLIARIHVLEDTVMCLQNKIEELDKKANMLADIVV